MIITLVREQLRAQRAALVWTGALLTLAVAIASAAVIAAATQWETDRIVADRSFLAEDYVASASWWSNGAPPLDDELGDDPGLLARGELESMVEQAIADGYSARAVHHTALRVQNADGSRAVDTDAGVAAQYPAQDWDSVLVDGSPPADGQIVLSSSVAEDLDVTVNDVVTLTLYEDSSAVVAQGVRVSGLSAPSVDGPFWSWTAAGHLTWADSLEYWTRSPAWTFENEAGEPTQLTFVDVGWQAGAPSMAPLMDGSWPAAWEDDAAPVFDPYVMQGWGMDALAASALVALALIGATFAMGRSQAQARVEWIATARVLGARRHTIVVASVLETIVVGAAASVIGIALGWVAVAGLLGWQRSAHPGVILPTAPALPPVALAVVTALALGMAAICALVPAFWSSRVSPSAALKPVTPVTTAQFSRSVSGAWLLVISLAAFVALIAGVAMDAYSLPGIGRYLAAFAAAALTVVVIADVVEINRRALPRVVESLARSGRPWALALSSTTAGRSRSWAAAASIMAIAAGALTMLQAWDVFNVAVSWQEESDVGGSEELMGVALMRALPELVPALVILLASGLACAVAAAVVVTARHAGRADDAVHAALGLSPGDARRAAAAEAAVPLGCGVMLGASVGWALVSIAHIAMLTQAAWAASEWWAATALTLVSLAAVALICLVPVALTSGAIALTARSTVPLAKDRVR